MNALIVSKWFERGLGYVALGIYEAIDNDYDSTPYVIGVNGGRPTGDEFDVEGLLYTNHYPLFKDPFELANDKGVDVVIFTERTDYNAIASARDGLDIKTVCVHMPEAISPSRSSIRAIHEAFDMVVVGTKFAYDHCLRLGLENVEFVRWGTDVDLFKPGDYDNTEHAGKAQIFHPAGFGGKYGRRGTRDLLDAMDMFNVRDVAELTITKQLQDATAEQEKIDKNGVTFYRGTFSRERMAEMYREGDIVVLPSRWEGIGLTFMEALASGKPIITVDAPPMNEYVVPNNTGTLVACNKVNEMDDVYVPQAILHPSKLARAIKTLARDKISQKAMASTARARAKDKYDWNKNGKDFVNSVKRLVYK